MSDDLPGTCVHRDCSTASEADFLPCERHLLEARLKLSQFHQVAEPGASGDPIPATITAMRLDGKIITANATLTFSLAKNWDGGNEPAVVYIGGGEDE